MDNQLLVLLVVGLLGFLLRGFTDSYIREKGKNTATKEDIGDITEKVESIRAQLADFSNFKSTRRDTQHKHLLAFHDTAIELLHERYAVNFGDLPMDDGKSLFAFQSQFKSNIAALLREHQRIVLFVPQGHTLLLHAQSIVKSAILSQGAFKACFGSVKTTSIAEQMAYSSGDKAAYRQAASEADIANGQFWDQMRPHIESFSKALSAYISELASFLANPANEQRG